MQIIKDCKIGINTKLWSMINLYGCTIGDNCMIGNFVEIQKDVVIGNDTKIQSHSFICSLVTIGNNCFISHGVMFVNDKYAPSGGKGWKQTIIGDSVMIGTNSTLLPVTIGEGAIIGAGSVVTKDIPENTVWSGNPARYMRDK